MPRVAFKQCDAQRLLRAAKAEGYSSAIVEIRPDGALRLLTEAPPARELTALEQWEAQYGESSPERR